MYAAPRTLCPQCDDGDIAIFRNFAHIPLHTVRRDTHTATVFEEKAESHVRARVPTKACSSRL